MTRALPSFAIGAACLLSALGQPLDVWSAFAALVGGGNIVAGVLLLSGARQ